MAPLVHLRLVLPQCRLEGEAAVEEDSGWAWAGHA